MRRECCVGQDAIAATLRFDAEPHAFVRELDASDRERQPRGLGRALDVEVAESQLRAAYQRLDAALGVLR